MNNTKAFKEFAEKCQQECYTGCIYNAMFLN